MRAALLFSLLALGLTACAPEGEGKDSVPHGPIPGYELAAAKAAAAPNAAKVVDLTVDQLRQMLAAGNVRLIDVRTAEEVAEGVIPGAEHIAMDDFDPAALGDSGGRDVVLYCRSGRRSGIVGERLAAYTGKPAAHLAGGIIAWKEAGGATQQATTGH
ncbi:rhodanese-like domain-containing protein [Erythrobacter sp. JK5]|uniref:rhodanese-like domain-containing protein n=1 Tax=Erythrobacter sp. JK5 TaxID=2829500 RepID=UPI001BAD2562|nr:rhodanese-like domain-containing protein [Erythrobacter sp. JK5]QUL37754.1 rhodanese-like domain-containing protein [Erythrobacter sp. JK5]